MTATEAAKTKKDCPDCKGTGDCADCDGTGKVAKVAEAEAKPKTKGKPKEMVDCAGCKGSGDCPNCSGDGTVTESARTAGENEMDETQVKKLIEAAVAPLQVKLTETETKLTEALSKSEPLLQRALKGDAITAATQALSGISMKEAGKQYVISECIKSIPVKNWIRSSFFFAASASALLAPSNTGFGAPSTRALASASPSPALTSLTAFARS